MFIHKKLFGAAKGAIGGFLTGGPLGALGGGIGGFVSGGRQIQRGTRPVGLAQRRAEIQFQIPPGIPRPLISGRLQETRPIGRDVGRGRSRLPMIGEIGVTPETMAVATRRCPTGQVLAIDGLCYPRAMVPQQFRQWKRKRPPMTVGDRNAIRKAASVRKRLVSLTRDAGAHASLTKPRKALPPGRS